MLIGVLLILFTSWLSAFLINATRRLKHINYAVLLFFYSIFATFFYLLYIIIEFLIILNNDSPNKEEQIDSNENNQEDNDEIKSINMPRILQYNQKQYGLLVVISLLNAFSKNLQTLA